MSSLIDKYRRKIYFLTYYFMLSLTFCYLYYQKLIVKADYYSYDSSSAIYPVLDFTALKVLQYRMLVPFTFGFLKLFIPTSDNGIYFILVLAQTMIILYVFYRLLGEYFEDRGINALIAPFILYPMLWNYTILNGQLFFVDFSLLIFILLGYYFIVKEKTMPLLFVLLLGCVNHDSVGFLIPMYVLYNYRRLFKGKIIVNIIAMVAIYAGVKFILSEVFVNSPGLSFRLNHIRNYTYSFEMPVHLVLRNIVLVFGGLHFFVLGSIRNGVWKRIPKERIMINFTILPYIVIIFFIHSIEEIRNYIAAMPFVLMPFLIYMSTLKGSFLKLKESKLIGSPETSANATQKQMNQ
ncbi:MAG: hypothetical protein JNK43_00995 [Ignavibacteria bacterium]|nr:hypothetical protein [Ignavibacteria bacterium]